MKLHFAVHNQNFEAAQKAFKENPNEALIPLQGEAIGALPLYQLLCMDYVGHEEFLVELMHYTISHAEKPKAINLLLKMTKKPVLSDIRNALVSAVFQYIDVAEFNGLQLRKLIRSLSDNIEGNVDNLPVLKSKIAKIDYSLLSQCTADEYYSLYANYAHLAVMLELDSKTILGALISHTKNPGDVSVFKYTDCRGYISKRLMFTELAGLIFSPLLPIKSNIEKQTLLSKDLVRYTNQKDKSRKDLKIVDEFDAFTAPFFNDFNYSRWGEMTSTSIEDYIGAVENYFNQIAPMKNSRNDLFNLSFLTSWLGNADIFDLVYERAKPMIHYLALMNPKEFDSLDPQLQRKLLERLIADGVLNPFDVEQMHTLEGNYIDIVASHHKIAAATIEQTLFEGSLAAGRKSNNQKL